MTRDCGPRRCACALKEGVSNAQRLMKLRNPALGELKAENLVDPRLVQELDQSGFIDQIYAAYSVK
jgi:hypothetical protein